MKYFPAAFGIALTAAIGTVQAQETNVMLDLGQRARVADGVFVMPVAVLEDSRCPTYTNCISAGRLMLSVRVTIDGTDMPMVLTLGAPQVAGKGHLTLNTVLPEPRGGTISPQDYSFTFSYAPIPTNTKTANAQ